MSLCPGHFGHTCWTSCSSQAGMQKEQEDLQAGSHDDAALTDVQSTVMTAEQLRVRLAQAEAEEHVERCAPVAIY